MAISNRDRIGKMFELLAPALDDFIARSVAPQLPEGASWTALVALKDKKKGIEGKEYDRLDPQVQLRMLTENIPHNAQAGLVPVRRRDRPRRAGRTRRSCARPATTGRTTSPSPTTTPTAAWTPPSGCSSRSARRRSPTRSRRSGSACAA